MLSVMRFRETETRPAPRVTVNLYSIIDALEQHLDTLGVTGWSPVTSTRIGGSMLTLLLTVTLTFQEPESQSPLTRYEKQGAKRVEGRIKAGELIRLDAKDTVVRVKRVANVDSAVVTLENAVSVPGVENNRVVYRTQIVTQQVMLMGIETKKLITGEVTLDVSGVYSAEVLDNVLCLIQLDPKAVAAIDAKRPKPPAAKKKKR